MTELLSIKEVIDELEKYRAIYDDKLEVVVTSNDTIGYNIRKMEYLEESKVLWIYSEECEEDFL